ncbi:hypothetical protein B6U74_05400 [Candidatus Bathyarchaeota archaeon ex4484_205]|nr:MAG: hypothetical protein B6U74_05400 [Candidatus Bathyarchaeota archaeon ex4484_205]
MQIIDEYKKGKSVDEIAKMLNVARSYIERIIRRAIENGLIIEEEEKVTPAPVAKKGEEDIVTKGEIAIPDSIEMPISTLEEIRGMLTPKQQKFFDLILQRRKLEERVKAYEDALKKLKELRERGEDGAKEITVEGSRPLEDGKIVVPRIDMASLAKAIYEARLASMMLGTQLDVLRESGLLKDEGGGSMRNDAVNMLMEQIRELREELRSLKEEKEINKLRKEMEELKEILYEVMQGNAPNNPKVKELEDKVRELEFEKKLSEITSKFSSGSSEINELRKELSRLKEEILRREREDRIINEIKKISSSSTNEDRMLNQIKTILELTGVKDKYIKELVESLRRAEIQRINESLNSIRAELSRMRERGHAPPKDVVDQFMDFVEKFKKLKGITEDLAPPSGEKGKSRVVEKAIEEIGGPIAEAVASGLAARMINTGGGGGGKASSMPTFRCKNCGYDIPIPDESVTEITCPKCGTKYRRKE